MVLWHRNLICLLDSFVVAVYNYKKYHTQYK